MNLTFLLNIIFIFSILVILKVIYELIRSLIANPPKPLKMNWKYQVLTGLSISYFISFILNQL